MSEAIQVALIVALIPLLGTVVNTTLQLITLMRTQGLEREVHRLNVGLDQHVQRLHRAHELVTQITVTRVLRCFHRARKAEPTEQHIILEAEESANAGELRGLAFAIGDKELLKWVNKGFRFVGLPSEERCWWSEEMSYRGRAQRLHTRISELLIEATEKK